MRRLRQLTQKEKIADLEESFNRLTSKENSFEKKMEIEHLKTRDECYRLRMEYEVLHKVMSKLDKIISQHEKTIKKQVNLIEDLDGTLRNVLLAVKQNEYLQAWYPEQKGHPEMKVVGHHPESGYSRSKV